MKQVTNQNTGQILAGSRLAVLVFAERISELLGAACSTHHKVWHENAR